MDRASDPPSLHKMWGGRFEGSASERAEAFGASIGFDHRLWRQDIMGSAAHCRMLAKQGILSRADAQQILHGLKTVAAEIAAQDPANERIGGRRRVSRVFNDIDPAWEDIHSWIENRLRALIGEPASRLHMARSRNDQVATDLRIFCREAILDEVDAISDAQQAFLDVATEYGDLLVPGFTHLQHAQPILFGHHLLAYVEMLERDADRLFDCFARTNTLPLGSGALAGVPYPIDRAEVARLLGFAAISRNSIDAVADRDFVVEHLAALATVGIHLSRYAEELVLWSSAEFDFVQIDEAHATGSSIMPQKRNPDVAELIRAKSGRLIGHLTAMLTVLKGLPLAYNKDLQEDKEALFDAVDTTISCLELTAEMTRGLRPRRDRMEAAAASGFSTATDYADYLAKKGLPFRDAHAVVGALVRLCERRGCDLADLTIEDLRGASHLFESDAVGMSARAVADARDVPGGTASSRIAEAQAEAAARLAARRARISRMRRELPSAESLVSEPLA